MRGNLTHAQRQLAFRLRAHGMSLAEIARQIGCSAPMIGLMFRAGLFPQGIPDDWEPREGSLTIGEREHILVGLRRGESMRSIARSLGRTPSTITREVAANGGRRDYGAWWAHRRARDCARRPALVKFFV